jgi:signal transduction histidine kinase
MGYSFDEYGRLTRTHLLPYNRRTVRLRTTLAALTIVVTATAVLIAVALFALTTALYGTTSRAANAMKCIHLVHGMQAQLLEHQQADPSSRPHIQDEIRDQLEEAWLFITTDAGSDALDLAESRVEAYFHVSRDASRAPEEIWVAYHAASTALDEFTDLKIEQSDIAERGAARWNRLANRMAITAGTLFMLVATALLVWLRTRAFEPILALADTMDRFGFGNLELRAIEQGPEELCEISRRFNEMASTIAAQRHAQLAFLGGVAHDLRGPLSNLQMSVALLLGERAVAADDGLRLEVERVGRQINRMERMLGDFLDGAKIEAGLLDLHIEVHDARTIVADVVALFEGTSAKHSFTTQFEDRAHPVRCDRLRLEQVLINLMSNAIKYSPSGGMVTVALHSRRDELELCVIDRGIGIPETQRTQLFEPFHRLGLSGAQAVPGVGLGLFMVRKIIEAHGGRIAVESVVGQGSSFRVFLPITG